MVVHRLRPAGQAGIFHARVWNWSTLDNLSYIALCSFVFMIPWGEGFPVIGGVLLANCLGALAFGLGMFRTIVRGRLRKPCSAHYAMIAFAAWVTLSLFWTSDWGTTVSRVGTYYQMLVLAYLIWGSATTETRVQGLLFSYVLGALVGSCDTFYNFMTGQTAAKLVAQQGIDRWETYRYTVPGINEDDFGVNVALAVPMIFYLIVSQRSRLVKTLCWIQLGAGFTAILLGAARGAALTGIVGLATFPLTMSYLPRWQRYISLTACLCLLTGAAFLVPASSWTRVLEVGSELSGGTLTHRTVIWAAGLEAFRNRAFLGVGAGAYGATVFRVIDIPFVAHNSFLSVLVELGVIGELILLMLLGNTFYLAVRMDYLRRLLWTILLLSWVIGVSSLTWEYRKPTWFLFSLLVAHADLRRREISRNMRAFAKDTAVDPSRGYFAGPVLPADGI